jgi:hypothetical protein
MNPGTLYILINASMPNLVKIGKTTKSAVERARELSSATGVATPFHVAYELPVSDCDVAERLLHERLASRRISSDREFFAIDVREAIERLRQLGAEFPITGRIRNEQNPIVVKLDDLIRTRDRLMLDYYEARRNGTATMTEDEIRAEVDRLSAEYILTKAAEQVDGSG